LLLLFIPAGLTESRSSKLALVAGLIILLAAYMAPVVVRWLLAATTILTIGWSFIGRHIFLYYPAMLAHVPPSWRARVEIWDYMSYRIEEKPWLGWGLGTTRTLDFLNPHGSSYLFTHMPAAHPHNVMTELWVELGIPGLALGIAFAFLTLWQISRLDRRLVPFALGAFTACLCFSLIAYDFWTDSLQAAFALTALAFAILQKQLTPRFSEAAPEAGQ
jgi:O-antigen ligase